MDMKVTGSCLQGFTKGKLCLANLIASDERTSPVDKARMVDVVYLDFLMRLLPLSLINSSQTDEVQARSMDSEMD